MLHNVTYIYIYTYIHTLEIDACINFLCLFAVFFPWCYCRTIAALIMIDQGGSMPCTCCWSCRWIAWKKMWLFDEWFVRCWGWFPRRVLVFVGLGIHVAASHFRGCRVRWKNERLLHLRNTCWSSLWLYWRSPYHQDPFSFAPGFVVQGYLVRKMPC